MEEIKKSQEKNSGHDDAGKDSPEKVGEKNNLNTHEAEVIKNYRKIIEKRKKRKTAGVKSVNIAVIILIIVMLFAVSLDAFLIISEKNKEIIKREEQARIEREKQAELDRIKEEIARKNKISAEILNFNDKYLIIRKDFYLKVEDLTKKLNSKVNSIQEIRELTDDRIKAALDYKDKLSTLLIPEVLNNFYNYELDFVNSDINLWKSISLYYSLEEASNFDINKIDESAAESNGLYLKAWQELETVYNKYELEYYLKDLKVR